MSGVRECLFCLWPWALESPTALLTILPRWCGQQKGSGDGVSGTGFQGRGSAFPVG